MQIKPSDISSIEEAGLLDGEPVKLIKTKGGFWIGIAKRKGKDEVLSAGSHPAIVKFNIEKQNPGFQPSMMKSENFASSAVVEKHSHYLSDDMRKSGHDVYSIQDGKNVDFHITKQNVKVALVQGSMDSDALILEKLTMPKEFARAMAGATTEKALSCNLTKVKVKK